MQLKKRFSVEKRLARGSYSRALDFKTFRSKQKLKPKYANMSEKLFCSELFDVLNYSLYSSIRSELTIALLSTKVDLFFEEMAIDLQDINFGSKLFSLNKELWREGMQQIENQIGRLISHPNLFVHELNLDGSMSEVLRILKRILGQKKASKYKGKTKAEALAQIKQNFFRDIQDIKSLFKLKFPDNHLEHFDSFIRVYLYPQKEAIKLIVGGKDTPYSPKIKGNSGEERFVESFNRSLKRFKFRGQSRQK